MRTLFIGGGTPTHLSAPQLARLLGSIRRWLPLEAGGEWSIEANPDTLDADKVAVLADLGVSRVSLGAQSFHPHLLEVLDRRHVPSQVAEAVERVRRRLAHVSLDLIFGAPGQTEAEWRADLAAGGSPAAATRTHVSTVAGLTYEKGTPLWKRRERGAVTALDEEAELALYRIAIETLEDAGFEQYEISNFARPGGRCRHNETYWLNHAYFGFGMGAARYVRGRRELNTRDLKTYLRRHRHLSGESPTFQSEELGPEERARETMAVMLRRRDGIDRRRFSSGTRRGSTSILCSASHRLAGAGRAEAAGGLRLARAPDAGGTVRRGRGD